MRRRDFLTRLIGGVGALSLGRPLASSLQSPSLQQQPPNSAARHGHSEFNDLAEYEELRHPLFAGNFDEALKVLLPRLKERPGTIPYVVATIYLRKEEYAKGIPYALQACRDVPTDRRHHWMLRALTMMAGL